MDDTYIISAIGWARGIVFFSGILGAHTISEIFSKGRSKRIHYLYSLGFMVIFAISFFYSI